MANIQIKLTKEQQQYLVFAVMFLGGGGYAYVKYFWLPTSAAITKTNAEIESVVKKITKAKGAAGKLKKIQQELELLNKQAEEAEKRLPKEEDFPTVVDTITGLARKYNVELKSFSTGKRQDQAHFVQLTYSISASAPYHDLGKFFASLALEERIYNVENVSYSPAEDTVSVNFLLISYMYKG
ncbi:MAG: type 4a pilus biogenesis protein PilO [Elusimicrobiota bacterium]